MTIQHRGDLGDALFTRLGTIAVDAPASALLRNDDDILYIRHPREGLTYNVIFAVGPFRRPLEVTQRRFMLSLPPNLDPRIRDLAGQVFGGCRTTADKIEAVVRHFRNRYTYAVGLDVPPDRDALTYFLLDASTGYCEYFASGAALLLRMADVPTRYVTGFFVTERDSLDDVWIARNSHAHAWVEAWDEDKACWTAVEATVSRDTGSALPSSGDRARGERWLLYQQFLRAAYTYGLFGPLAWAVTYRPIWAAVASVAGAMALAGLLVIMRRAGARPSDGRGLMRRPDPVHQAMWRLLARVDRRVRRWGLARGPDETVLAFSTRVEQHDPPGGLGAGAVQWYRRYSDLRYRPVLTAQDVHDLDQAARSLP